MKLPVKFAYSAKLEELLLAAGLIALCLLGLLAITA